MDNLKLILNGREPLVSYDNEFNGVRYFHIRRMWKDKTGRHFPGKQGISVPMSEKESLIEALKSL
jgi:hypothetical protein